jgi:histidine triad (HIT) family protein
VRWAGPLSEAAILREGDEPDVRWHRPHALDGSVGMTTIFTRIINGDEPARFVWRDARCVAFLSTSPLRPGHTLLVPIAEVDHWIDLDRDLAQHLMSIAQTLGSVLQDAFRPRKIGLFIGGLDVPHVHIHLVPLETKHDMDYDQQEPDPSEEQLEEAHEKIRSTAGAVGLHVP